MDPLDLAILALRVGVVLLLYAFLFAVLRAARWALADAGQERALRTSTGSRSSRAATILDPALPAELSLRLIDGEVEGLRQGQVVTLADRDVIGRGTGADLVLTHPTVSSQHARVQRLRNGWSIEDLGSTNGTFVNGERIAEARALQVGDGLQLGGLTWQVV